MLNDKDKQLISMYIDGETTPEETIAAEALIIENPSAQSYYKELTKLSKIMNDSPAEEVSFDLKKELQESLKRVVSSHKELPMKSNKKQISTLAGTTIIALVALSVSLNVYNQTQKYEFTPIEYKRVESPKIINQSVAGGKFAALTVPETAPLPVKNDTNLPVSDGTKLAVLSVPETTIKKEHSVQPKIERQNYLLALAASKPKETKRLKSATDDIGDQFSPSKTGYQQTTYYEPYYQASEYNLVEADYRMPETQAAVPQVARMAAVSEKSVATRVMTAGTDLGYINSDVTFSNEVYYPQTSFNTEEYSTLTDNHFIETLTEPFSTFSIDVDTGSYSNIRRFLNQNQLPPVDAVRIEEMINYFKYNYPNPQDNEAFSITAHAAKAPWNPNHNLVMLGLKGRELKEIPPSNLVFLIDVSGSMNQANKLPLLKTAFTNMVNQLGKNERVSIVVYAGAAGQVLPPTSGADKHTIINAINNLAAGGSTAGGAGIQLAYKLAQESFIRGGNNRVILATDGDFNVGISSTSDMTRLIEEKRDQGIFLTVLGFGMGNYKDGRLEQIANKGNGNYYYIDTINEANKVLVDELGSTLFTIAKDVKLQIEFNPSEVKAYRLIGYVNRKLNKEDFNDDTKDAGEIGAGHTVTALYEIIPADSNEVVSRVDAPKYQTMQTVKSNDLMTVKLRYKEPTANVSQKIEKIIPASNITEAISGDFAFVSSIVEFGMLLRQSQYRGQSNYNSALQRAMQNIGSDKYGYRAEFIELIRKAQQLDTRVQPVYKYDVDNQNTGGIRFK